MYVCVCVCVRVCCCCCSVAKSCLTLWDPMDCSTPDIPVLYYLSPRVCLNSCPLSWWCPQTISSSVILFSPRLQSFLASGSFPVSWLFVSGGQNIGASTSASVLPMNIQGWFSLGVTDLISLLSKGLARSSPAPQFKKINYSAPRLLYGPALTSIHD